MVIRSKLLSVSVILFSISLYLLSCKSDPAQDKDTVVQEDSAVSELPTFEGPPILIAFIDEDGWPTLLETEGILKAVLEEKFNGEILLEHVEVSLIDDKIYYLEGRGKDQYVSPVVALELIDIGGDSLAINPNGKLHACVPVDTGLCVFISEGGIITGCDCNDVDTTSTCTYTVSADVLLPL